jgi:hypothetical protein
MMHVGTRSGPAVSVSHIGVDAPRFALPAVGVLHPSHGQNKSKAVESLFQLAQLVEVGRVLRAVVGKEQRPWGAAGRLAAMRPSRAFV